MLLLREGLHLSYGWVTRHGRAHVVKRVQTPPFLTVCGRAVYLEPGEPTDTAPVTAQRCPACRVGYAHP